MPSQLLVRCCKTPAPHCTLQPPPTAHYTCTSTPATPNPPHTQPTGASLQRLDLHDNPLTAEVAPALARVVAAHPQLRVLNLNDTSLTDEGAAVLAEALASGARDLQVLLSC